MLTLTERPELWSFSRNFIRYRFIAAQLAGQLVEVQVRLYVGDVAGTPANDKLVTVYQLVPAPDGTCDVYIEDLIDAHLQWQMPNPAPGTITPVTTHTCSFFIEYREITLLSPNPGWNSDIASRRLAIKAGLPVDLFNRSNPANFSQFTYQAAQVARVGVSDHFFRTFVSFSIQQTTYRAAVLSVLFSDNTTQTATIVFSSLAYHLYQVPASPAAWGLTLTPGKVPVSYQVRINETIAGAPVSRVLIDAVIDHNWYRQVHTMQYHNSLGGLDFMRLLGDTDIENDRSYTDGETILGADYNQPALRGQYQQRGISIQKTFKGDAGYFMNPVEQEVAQELDLSESVWQLKKLDAATWQWVQLRITNKPRKLRSRSSKRWNYEVEFQYAFNMTAFSNLPYPGLGTDTNTYTTQVCGLVSGLAVSFTTSNGFNYAQFTWTAGQNGWLYHLQYREAGSSSWPFTISTYTTNFMINVDAGKTYEWRVSSLCSLTDSSPYVNGPTFTT